MIMLTERDQRKTLKKENSSYEKVLDMNDDNCKPKSLLGLT